MLSLAGEGYIGAAPTDDVQLHTFTATAPPPYEEVGPRSAATPAPSGPLEEREVSADRVCVYSDFSLVPCHSHVDFNLGTKHYIIRTSVGVPPDVCYSAVEAAKR